MKLESLVVVCAPLEEVRLQSHIVHDDQLRRIVEHPMRLLPGKLLGGGFHFGFDSS